MKTVSDPVGRGGEGERISSFIIIIRLNFQFFAILAVCVILAKAAPQGNKAPQAPIPIISQSTDLQPDGSYKYR